MILSTLFVACSNQWSEMDKQRLGIVAMTMVTTVKKDNKDVYINCYKNSVMDKYSGQEFISSNKRPEIMLYVAQQCAK